MKNNKIILMIIITIIFFGYNPVHAKEEPEDAWCEFKYGEKIITVLVNDSIEFSKFGNYEIYDGTYAEGKKLNTVSINIETGNFEKEGGKIKCPDNIYVINTDFGYAVYDYEPSSIHSECDKDKKKNCYYAYSWIEEKTVDFGSKEEHAKDPTGESTKGDGDNNINIQTGDPMTCDSLKNTATYKIVKQVFKWIQIIAPIMLVIFGVIDFATPVISGDNDAIKKAQSKFIKRVIVVAAIVLLPFIMDLLISLLDGAMGNNIGTCEINN